MQDEFEQEERKMPEFIYVESEKRSTSGFGGFQSHFGYSFQNLENKNFPFQVRLLSLIGAFLLAFVTLIVLPFVFLFAILNTVTLFRVESIKRKLFFAWGIFKKMLVVTLGLLIAFFSPSFGFSVIMIYFLSLGQPIEQGWFSPSQFKNWFF